MINLFFDTLKNKCTTSCFETFYLNLNLCCNNEVIETQTFELTLMCYVAQDFLVNFNSCVCPLKFHSEQS